MYLIFILYLEGERMESYCLNENPHESQEWNEWNASISLIDKVLRKIL